MKRTSNGFGRLDKDVVDEERSRTAQILESREICRNSFGNVDTQQVYSKCAIFALQFTERAHTRPVTIQALNFWAIECALVMTAIQKVLPKDYLSTFK